MRSSLNLVPESRPTVRYHGIGGDSAMTHSKDFADKLNPSTNNWDQDVYIDNVLKSSISTSKHY